jgi:N-acyl-D-aspartate/D-glutamate deacylase
MEHEVVIRGGTIVDGTGAEPFVGDLAIERGRIAAIGRALPAGREEVDAAGAIVTPGFVDLHTHYDAQVGWDPLLRPSSQHGVTTALLGNCGMGFAPVRRDAHVSLARMMEAVEDIPSDAILDGLPWDWESYGEYLDTVERLGVALNVAGLVGHSPLRSYVMGGDAVDGHPTGPQRDEQATILSRAMGDGAAGFSTSRYLGHRLPDGRCVPGTDARIDELRALAHSVGGGLFQVVLNDQAFRAEIDLLRTLAAEGARVLFLVGVGDDERSGESARVMFERFEADGLDITGMIGPRPGGLIVGVSASLLPWRSPRWAELHRRTPMERLAAFADPVQRAALVAEADASDPFLPATQIFPLGLGQPTYVADASGSLASVSAACDETPAEHFVRVALESGGAAYFTARLFNRNVDAIEQALRSPRVLPGLGDAGAHVGQVMDAGWTTFWLAHWVRDRQLFTLAEGVRRITSMPATLLGLTDRGRLDVGAHADVNVIDLARLAPGPVSRIDDLPGGAGRLTQPATGYRATFVNGSCTLRDDAHTGVRAGEVLRRFAA